MKASNNHINTGRGILVAIILFLFTTAAFAQHLAVTGGTFTGSGTYNIAGNITNTGVASISGTTTLNGAAAQSIGTGGALTFGTLNVNTSGGTPTTTMGNAVTVSTALSIAATSTLAVSNKTLTINGTSTLNGGGLLTTASGSTVVYGQTGTSQVVLGVAYSGALTLSGTSTKSFSAGTNVAETFTHSDGDVTIDQDLTIPSASPSFATIANISSGKTLTLSGTGAKSITAITTTVGNLNHSGASGLLTIATLNGNTGTISGGAGGITFTNAAANSGNITGGAGAITFSNTLAHSGGTITAGGGDINFTGVVTRSGSSSLASADVANILNFATDVNGTAGTIDLTVTGAAEFGGAVASTTGLNFATGTTVTYDQGTAGQAIADVNYGYLTLKNNTKTWSLGAARTINNDFDVQASSATSISGSFNLNISGNVALASNVTKSANAVVFANASSAVSGTNEISGSVTRTHGFAASAYTFNNSSMTMTPSVVGTLSSFTVTSEPGVNPTAYSATNTINRKYTPSYAGAGFTVDLKLSYLSGEATGVTENKLKQFQGVVINNTTKLTGTYTRQAAGGGFGFVSLAALTPSSLASGTEVALDDRFNTFTSTGVTADWHTSSTWDEGSIPTSTDDVVIANNNPVTIANGGNASALSTTINATATGLTVGAGASGTLAIGSGGLTNNNTGTGLTVSVGGAVTITSGTLTNSGAVTNNGTITIQ